MGFNPLLLACAHAFIGTTMAIVLFWVFGHLGGVATVKVKLKLINFCIINE